MQASPDNQINVFLDGNILRKQKAGGVSTYLHYLARHLSQFQWLNTQLVLWDRRNNGPELDKTMVPPRQVSPRWLRGSERYRRWSESRYRQKLEKTIASFSPSIYHSIYFELPPASAGESVVTVYDLIYEVYRNEFNTAADEAFRNHRRKLILAASHLIAISQHTKDDMVRIWSIDPDRISVVHLGVDADRWKRLVQLSESGSASSGKYLLFVGSRAFYKNFSLLVEAVRWFPELSIIAAGQPCTDMEEAMLRQHRMKNRVRFEVHPGDLRLAQLYSQSLALVYPSSYEGFGLPLLEAMACETQVIATNATAIPEITGEAAILFEDGSVDSLRGAINIAIKSRNLVTSQSLGIERCEMFPWSRSAKLTAEIYRSISDRA